MPAGGVLARRVHQVQASIQFDQKLGPGLLQAGSAATGLSTHHQTSRQMTQPAAVLVLVAMLTTGASAAEPLDLEVDVRSALMRITINLTGFNHGDSHSRRVNPTSLLIGGHTLNAMTASLMIETISSLTRDLKDDGLMAGAPVRLDVGASCSSFALGQTQISDCELGHELACIVAAFAGAYLDGAG
ncbi:hypothetical protein BSY19_4957 (plasmid) [Bosea sp. RAC05]|nr:hypothetical protein BSY19_4957 [Bosea sp. RAC05]